MQVRHSGLDRCSHGLLGCGSMLSIPRWHCAWACMVLKAVMAAQHIAALKHSGAVAMRVCIKQQGLL